MRSEILRDAARIIALLSEDTKLNLTEADRNCLSLPALLSAFQEARHCESVRPRLSLVATGTWSKYMRVVDHLARDRPHDPFETFRRQCRNDDGVPGNTRQGARSALVRHAAYLVDLHLPIFLRALYRRLPIQEDRNLLSRAVRMRLLSHSPDQKLPGTYLEMVPDAVLIDLARAARFLLENPSDPHGTRPRETAHERRPRTEKIGGRNQTKRKALRALTRLDWSRQRTDLDCDWRGVFWDCTTRHAVGVELEAQIMIALLMVTGCRPEAAWLHGRWKRASTKVGEQRRAGSLLSHDHQHRS